MTELNYEIVLPTPTHTWIFNEICGFSRKIKIVNKSFADLYIVNSNGFVEVVRPSFNSFKNNSIKIVVTYTFSSCESFKDTYDVNYQYFNNLKEEIRNNIINNKKHVEHERFLLTKIMHKMIEDGGYKENKNLDIILYYDIELPNSANVVKSLYVPYVDSLIHVNKNNENIPHPKLNDKKSESVRVSNGIDITIVDNENTINKRYIYLGKKVTAIETIKDSSRASGVYVVRYDIYKNFNDFSYSYYDFKEAEIELGLYSTKEDAYSFGDPKLVLETKLNKKEREIIDKEEELYNREKELKKNQQTLKDNENKFKSRVEEEVKINTEKLRRENEELKAEINKNKTKWYTEIFKLIAAVVPTILLIINIFRK